MFNTETMLFLMTKQASPKPVEPQPTKLPSNALRFKHLFHAAAKARDAKATNMYSTLFLDSTGQDYRQGLYGKDSLYKQMDPLRSMSKPQEIAYLKSLKPTIDK